MGGSEDKEVKTGVLLQRHGALKGRGGRRLVENQSCCWLVVWFGWLVGWLIGWLVAIAVYCLLFAVTVTVAAAVAVCC